MTSRKFVFAALLGLLAACQPLVERAARSTALPVFVSIPAEIHPRFRERIIECAAGQPEAALLVNDIAGLDSPGIQIRLGEPKEEQHGFSFLLGWEDIRLIANPQSDVDLIVSEDIGAFFSNPPAQFEIWAYPNNHPLRELFDEVILGDSEISPFARLAPNPEAMLEAVSSRENAVGYLPASWLNSAVAVVELNPHTQNSLQMPVLGVTAEEPEGVVRSILVCMQNGVE